METLQNLLEVSTIIPAVRGKKEFEKALESSCTMLFLLSPSLETIGEQMQQVHQKGKKAFIHLDLMDGLRRDKTGLRYVVKEYGVDGILTTHSSMVKIAREQGISCIQRLFVIDTESLITGVQSLRRLAPDAIELMPGTILKAIQSFRQKIEIPIIAGGLIDTKQEIYASLGAGALSVSTSNTELWDL